VENYTFQNLIAPLSADDFFEEHWGEAPAFIGGPNDKFSDLWSWEDFNVILGKTRHWSERTCWLTQDGALIPTEHYCYDSLKRDQLGIQRPNFEQVGEAINAGAALFLDRIETLRPTLANTTANLRARFGAPTNGRLSYAKHAQALCQTGFEAADLLLLQIEGDLTVHLFEGCFENPLTEPDRKTGSPPQSEIEALCGDLAAEIPMGPGDLLYIPAGQFFNAATAPGPSAQLLFTIRRPTGLNFVDFLLQHMPDDPLFRSDMPFFDEPEATRSRIDAMANAIQHRSDEWALPAAYRNHRLQQTLKAPLAPLGLPRPNSICKFRRRNVVYQCEQVDAAWEVTGPNGKATISMEQKKVCDWLLDQDVFDLRRFEDAFPDQAESQQVISSLADAGILESL